MIVEVATAIELLEVIDDYDPGDGDGPGPCVHSYRGGMFLIGAHWKLDSVRAAFEQFGVSVSEDLRMTATGHWLACKDEAGWVYFAARKPSSDGVSDRATETTLEEALVKFAAVDRNEWLDKLILTGDEARAVSRALSRGSVEPTEDTLAEALERLVESWRNEADLAPVNIYSGRMEAVVLRTCANRLQTILLASSRGVSAENKGANG